MDHQGKHQRVPDSERAVRDSVLADDLGAETLAGLVQDVQAAARAEAAARGRMFRSVAELYAKAMTRRGEQAVEELRSITPWAFAEPGAVVSAACPEDDPSAWAEEDPSAPDAPANLTRRERKYIRARVAAVLAERKEDTVIRDVAAEIAVALMLAAGTARAVVEDALVLAGDLPDVLCALEAGAVTWANARVILKHWRTMTEMAPCGMYDPLAQGGEAQDDTAQDDPLTDLNVSPVEVWESAREVTARLVSSSAEATTKQLDDLGYRLRAKLGRKAAERAHASARRHRAVWVTREEDGLAHVHALVDAVTARGIDDRLHRLSTAVEANGRTQSEVRADVFGDLLLEAEPAEGSGLQRGVRGQVSVLVPVQYVMPVQPVQGNAHTERDNAHTERDNGHALPHDDDALRSSDQDTARIMGGDGSLRSGTTHQPGPCMIEGFGPVSIREARQLAAQCKSWRRILTDGGSGVVLQHGRETYAVPEGLRRTLRLRDETCRFPGCRRPAGSSDLDHTVAWEDGGATEDGNLAHLCRHHHRIKHEAGALGPWSVRHVDGAPPGTLEWTSGTGIIRRTHPPGDVSTGELAASSRSIQIQDDPPPF